LNNKTDASVKFYMDNANSFVDILTELLSTVYLKTFENDFDVFMDDLWVKPNDTTPAILDSKVLNKNEKIESLEKTDWKNLKKEQQSEWYKRMDLQTLLKALRFRNNSMQMFCEKNGMNKDEADQVFSKMINWRNYGVGHRTVYKYEKMNEKTFKEIVLEPVWQIHDMLSRYNEKECKNLKKQLLEVERKISYPEITIEALKNETGYSEEELREELAKIKVFVGKDGSIKGEEKDELVNRIERLSRKKSLIKWFKRKTKRERIIWGVSGCVVLLAIVITSTVIIINNSYSTISASEYIKLNPVKGYSGSGLVEEKNQQYVETDKLINKIVGVAKKNETITPNESKKIKNELKNSYISINVDKVSNIKNGDIITVNVIWDKKFLNKLGIKLVDTEYEQTINKLKKAEMVDPFKDLRYEIIDSEKENDVNYYVIKLKNDKYPEILKDDVYTIDNEARTDILYIDVDNGWVRYPENEVLRIRITDKKSAELQKNHHISITKKQGTISLRMQYLSSGKDISDKSMKIMKSKFESEIDYWVHDKASLLGATKKDVQYLGCAIAKYTDDNEANRLYLAYKVTMDVDGDTEIRYMFSSAAGVYIDNKGNLNMESDFYESSSKGYDDFREMKKELTSEGNSYGYKIIYNELK